LNSGVFACTEQGVYKFQIYSLTKTDTQLFLELVHNGAVVASLWGYTTADYAAAGNAVILTLAEGDNVWVETLDNLPVDLYGATDEIYTTFTGVKMGVNSPDGKK